MRRLALLAALTGLAGAPTPARGQGAPSPRTYLGFEVGTDRTLADWAQITGYFAALAAASTAVELDTLGKSTGGRPFILATISSPDNIRKIREIRAAQARLADPRALGAADEARLIATQPSVVLISCNIHAGEIASSQMAMELAHRLATNDTLQRRLANTVVLLVPSMNPDGEQMVTEWYRTGLNTRWEGGPLPWLYHLYAGHDNNRDWFMVTQKETRLVTDLLYRRWFPEVFYDVHQMGSEGARIFVPPFVDPIDPNVDPLIVRGIGLIGATMAMALESRGKSGVADRVIYDLWWHGGARSTPTRHNMIGLLTEAASVKVATPITQKPAELTGHERGLPKYQRQMNFPNPWPGGTWRLRDIVDYELIAAEALVTLASDRRAEFVRNFVTLGRKEIRLGATQPPFAYQLRAKAGDGAALDRLVEVLRLGGVEVERHYGSGTFYLRMAQPYRAHAKDLLEVQRFPRMERWPGGPSERPYDVAGWTLPMQMGVEAIPIDTPLTVGTVRRTGAEINDLTVPVRGLRVEPLRTKCNVEEDKPPRPARRGRDYFVIDARDTESYRLMLRALRRRVPIIFAPRILRRGDRVAESSPVLVDKRLPAGIPLPAGSRDCSRTVDVTSLPGARALARAPRVGVYKPWTANIDEGWTRWVLEQFEFPYASLTDSAVKAGALRDQFDVILVSDMSLREARDGMSDSLVPPRYAGGLGKLGLAELRRFVELGGTVVLLDRASEIGTEALGVPLKRITVPPRSDDDEAAPAAGATGGDLSNALYAPGSILRVLVDARQPVAYGMPDTAAVYFTNSVTFEVPAGSAAKVVARYPERGEDILLSGYLQGADAIAGKAAAVDVPMGRGRVIMFGFRPQFRGQSFGTFKMLFNALLDGGASAARR